MDRNEKNTKTGTKISKANCIERGALTWERCADSENIQRRKEQYRYKKICVGLSLARRRSAELQMQQDVPTLCEQERK